MAKPIPTQEHQTLLDAVAQYPQGAGIDHIEAKLSAPPARRTVQRWLNQLIAQNKLRKEGQGRATRYFPSQNREAAPRSDSLIPLSADATAVLRYVRQPVQKRTPVGYNRAF